MKYLQIYISCCLSLLLSCENGRTQNRDLQLWYDRPVGEWTEALTVGNGSLGGMIYGGVESTHIQLNEESVWTGEPIARANPRAKAYLDSVRALLFAGEYTAAEQLAQQKIMGRRLPTGTHTYQTLGNLYLDFNGGKQATNYRRLLNLEKALAKVSYRNNGIQYTREVFSSYPDQVMAMHLSANQSGQISFTATLDRPGEGEKVVTEGDQILMQQQVGDSAGVRYMARLKVVPEGGQLTSTDSTLTVSEADGVTLLLAAATDYRGGNPDQITKDRIQSAASYSYEELKKRHITDYQKLFDRVSLDITPEKVPPIPTDQRLENVKGGEADPYLTELYFQYGRYLLISSSRPGSLPANLQGLWAKGLSPPWNADYHTNINLQMNYWPVEMTNLAETAHPLFDFVEALNKRGQKVARQVYGAKGTVAHHTTDAWHFAAPIGKTYYGLWPMGGAWLSMHFWEHYRFTQDQVFLRDRAYPQLKKAAIFFVDYLTVDPHTGKLVTGPSMSPENQFITPEGETASVAMGPTMDMQIVNELFAATIKASEMIGVDAAFRDTLRQMESRLAPTQIGADGTIMEWRKDFKEADPGHRHISHLYSLYPGRAINAKDSPKLFQAARKTIDRRLANGGGHTGWSRAWIINFFARLTDGAKAHKNMLALH